jgi:uncharacterized protein YehS (DUF1456 family)
MYYEANYYHSWKNMTNNDLLRRLRFILNIKDTKIIKILALVDYQVPLPRVVSWLKKPDDEDFTICSDKDLTAFLDGLIIEKRGKKEPTAGQKTPSQASQPIERLTNNLIFLKLKIAFDLKSDDVLEMLELAEYNISPSELTAFFRKKTHRHYRVCKDQLLRKFLKGLQLKLTA